jgi:beta-phosphoglucomutase
MAERGALWDLDGVLVDTGEFHFQAWSQALSEYAITSFTEEFFRATFGMNNAGVLSSLLGYELPAERVAEISGRKEDLFRQAVRGRVQPLSGARVWVERLKGAGVRQAIASSAPQANIDTLVDELGLRPYFEAIVSGANLPGKPDPAVFLEAAHLIGVPPARCVVIEDAVAGVEAARRAGMRCIAVTTTNPAHTLEEAGADVVVERLDALALHAFTRLHSSQQP